MVIKGAAEFETNPKGTLMLEFTYICFLIWITPCPLSQKLFTAYGICCL